MVSSTRWQTAQAYERDYWESQARAIAAQQADQLDWYRWRADALHDRLSRLGRHALLEGAVRAIEVGSGPVGLLSYFPSPNPVLVDPLADFYGTHEALAALRRPDATYVAAGGESMPVETAAFDLAVIENCIDHVQDADGVLRELRRVLRPGGTLFLTVNCRSAAGYYVHRLISSLRLDPGHPHTFTPDRAVARLEASGFSVDDLEVGSYEQERAADLASNSRKARLKARLGVSEYLASIVATRRP